MGASRTRRQTPQKARAYAFYDFLSDVWHICYGSTVDEALRASFSREQAAHIRRSYKVERVYDVDRFLYRKRLCMFHKEGLFENGKER